MPINENSKTPGPGAYPLQYRSLSPAWTFGSRHSQINNEERSPGPAAYDIPQSRVITTKIAKSQSPAPSYNFPGPGSYNPKRLEQSPSYTSGFSQRYDPSKSHKDIPRPGAYDTKLLSSTVGGKISPLGRGRRKSEIYPGPGAYDPKLLENSVSFTLGPKREEKLSNTPGPGSYDPRLNHSAGFSIGKKIDQKEKEGPGPGAYTLLNKAMSPAWTFNSRPTFTKKKDESPGPGQYYLTSMLNSKGVSFSKVERKPEKSLVPGPGQYNTEKPRGESPAFSLGKSGRINFAKQTTDTPGPGAYDSSAKTSLTTVSAKFPKAKRSPSFEPDSNTEFYKIELKASGPFYSMQGKRPEIKANTTPVKVT